VFPSKKFSDAVEDFQLEFSHPRNITREKPTAAFNRYWSICWMYEQFIKSDKRVFSRPHITTGSNLKPKEVTGKPPRHKSAENHQR